MPENPGAGVSLDEFRENFETVTREQIVLVLENFRISLNATLALPNEDDHRRMCAEHSYMGLFDLEEAPDAAKDDKNRLFETHKTTKRSLGGYVKLLLGVAVFVAVAGFAVAYFTLPDVGDAVKGPTALEQQIRLHFLDVEKRDATDLSFFQCEDFYWVRVGVETRPDIPGKPHNMVAKYRAKATAAADGKYTIAASPILAGEEDVPCKF